MRGLLGGVVMALAAACSPATNGGGAGGSGGIGSGGEDPSHPGSCSATGTWHSNFQWSNRTPGDLALVVSEDDRVQVPNAPGVGATTGNTTVDGHTITWTLADGSTMRGTADATCSFIADGMMSNQAGSMGQFTARKNACDFDGAWDVTFQWSGRTPGELSILVSPDQSAMIPSGPGVSEASGTTDIDGFDVTWTMSDGAVMTGTADANCQVISNGTMRSKTGTMGRFTAHK